MKKMNQTYHSSVDTNFAKVLIFQVLVTELNIVAKINRNLSIHEQKSLAALEVCVLIL